MAGNIISIVDGRISSSILIAMAKDKFLNEKDILAIDSKYVKYSIYDLLRYFLIFNGIDISNFTNYTRNTGYRGQQSLGTQNLSQLESTLLTKNQLLFFSNINETSKPFNYSLFYYLISNKNISVDHKLELCCIALRQGADPNIMPNIAQDLLSQIDSKLNICAIFKMFLGYDYEKIIKIFKLYTTKFSNGMWDDKLGEIQKVLTNQKKTIDDLRKQLNRLSLQNTSKPSSSLSSLNLATTGQRSQVLTLGGSKIKLRTFHFLEPKTYNEHAFRAEKPIIAGKMAYDFLRTHYKLKKNSSIIFTIEDRIKNCKYNYIGEKINNKIIIKST